LVAGAVPKVNVAEGSVPAVVTVATLQVVEFVLAHADESET
jgi:hypothetical protein